MSLRSARINDACSGATNNSPGSGPKSTCPRARATAKWTTRSSSPERSAPSTTGGSSSVCTWISNDGAAESVRTAADVTTLSSRSLPDGGLGIAASASPSCTRRLGASGLVQTARMSISLRPGSNAPIASDPCRYTPTSSDPRCSPRVEATRSRYSCTPGSRPRMVTDPTARSGSQRSSACGAPPLCGWPEEHDPLLLDLAGVVHLECARRGERLTTHCVLGHDDGLLLVAAGGEYAQAAGIEHGREPSQTLHVLGDAV